MPQINPEFNKPEVPEPAAPNAFKPVPFYQLPWSGADNGNFVPNARTSGNADLIQQDQMNQVSGMGSVLARGGHFNGRSWQAGANGKSTSSGYSQVDPTQQQDSWEDYAKDRAQAGIRSTIERGKAMNSGQVQSVNTVPTGASYWDGKSSMYDGQGRRMRVGADGVTEFARDGGKGTTTWSPSSEGVTGLTPEQIKQQGLAQLNMPEGASHIDGQGRAYTGNPAAIKQTSQAAALDGQIKTLGEQMRANPNNTEIGNQWLALRRQRGEMEGKIYSGKPRAQPAAPVGTGSNVAPADTGAAATNKPMPKAPLATAKPQPAGLTAVLGTSTAPKPATKLPANGTPVPATSENLAKGAKPSEGAKPIGKEATASAKLGSAIDYIKQSMAIKYAGQPVGKTPNLRPGLQKQPPKPGVPPKPVAATETAPAKPFQPSFQDAIGRLQSGDIRGLADNYLPLFPDFVQKAMGNLQAGSTSNQQTATTQTTQAPQVGTPTQAGPTYAQTYRNPAVANANQAVQAIQTPARQTASGSMQGV